MSETQGKGAFDALLEEIGAASAETQSLSKALSDTDVEGGKGEVEGAEGEGTEKDDAAIAAAAAEGDAAGEGEGEGDGVLGKALRVTMADGTEADAFDAGALVKSFNDRIGKSEASTAEVLGAAMALIKDQGTLVKSLVERITVLGGAGRGRKAVLTIAERPAATAAVEALTKSHQAEGVSGEEFMSKALACQNAGKLTGRQVSEAEAHINMNLAPPADIVRIVLAAE